MDCNEIFLNEVTHVELVAASACTIPVPSNAKAVTELSGCTIGTPTMVVDSNDNDSYTGVLDSAPTLKSSQKDQVGGRLRQHDLTLTVRYNYNKVRKAVDALQGVYFYVILRTADGTRYLLYSLQNTSKVTVEDQFGSAEPKQTVKVSLQSLSNMIQLT